MIKYIPNILTFLRIIAIPFFIWLSLSGMSFYALMLFVFACITDYYDGMVARKYNIITNFGKIMDPLADKALVLAALILLNIAPISYIHWSITLIIALREIAVTTLRHIYQKKNIIIPADIWGKIKTTVQMIGVISALFFYMLVQNTPNLHDVEFMLAMPQVLNYLSIMCVFESEIVFYIQIYFWIVAIITILSGMNYFFIKNKGSSQ